jgi:4-amino-4-deoxy-L-arabinose transferase-like glycosyltransferase
MADGGRRFRHLLILAGVLLLAFILRAIHLQSRPLWYDEAFAVLYASLSPEKMAYGTITPVADAAAADVHPLLYYFLLHGWMVVVGRSPFAVRFLSVILGTLTVGVLSRLATDFLGRRVGLWAGVLAALNPFHVAYSQETRMYALLGLAAVLAAWSLLRALERQRFRWWAAYTVAAAVTLYAHNLGSFFLLGLHGLVLLRSCGGSRLRALAVADGGVLLLFAPWLIGVLPGQLGFVRRGYWLARPGAQEAVRALMLPFLSFYEPPPRWLLAPALFAALALLVLLILQTWRTRSRAGWFLLLGWAPVLSLWAASLWRPLYLERALLPAALCYLIAIAWLLSSRTQPKALRIVLVGLSIGTMAGTLVHHYTYRRFPRPPFDVLVAFLHRNVRAEEIVIHDNKLTFFPAHYYAPQLPQAFAPDPRGSGSDTLALPTQAALGLYATPVSETLTTDVSGVWYVAFEQTWAEYRALGSDDAPTRKWLRAHCLQDEAPHKIADLEIYHFVACEADV